MRQGRSALKYAGFFADSYELLNTSLRRKIRFVVNLLLILKSFITFCIIDFLTILWGIIQWSKRAFCITTCAFVRNKHG